jgi:predicted transcriptional regulator
MKISANELKDLSALHSLILEGKGRGFIDDLSKKLNLSQSRLLKLLNQLKILGIIGNLNVTSKIFKCIIFEKDRIDVNLLMNKYGFILWQEENKEEAGKKDVQIKMLKKENEELKNQIHKMQLEIKMLKTYGKSLIEKLKDVEVVSGD